ncbi:hypothetical protein K525DRAFT_193607 [Schizophyllum commune Loenen D]|nr:hypothetical protein K525DRAFT_193607 [Schizophyllum commune Loenen D]
MTTPCREPSSLSTSPTSMPTPPPSPPSAQAPTKRAHALQELILSERAYASDLTLINQIYVPLARGEAIALPTPPASRASTSSDNSVDGLPMSPEDVDIIFGNVAELAGIAQRLAQCLEQGEEDVGTLFLQVAPTLEAPYARYITRHDYAAERLSAIPRTPAYEQYIATTQALAARYTTAWDLASLLIKPVQRLLKYPLLLGALHDATPESHPDRPALYEAKCALEEIAGRINEQRRRKELVLAVLNGKPGPQRKRVEEDHQDYWLVCCLSKRLFALCQHITQFARAIIAYASALHDAHSALDQFSQSFARALEATGSGGVQAYLALVAILRDTELETETILSPLFQTLKPVKKGTYLCAEMFKLSGAHHALLNTPITAAGGSTSAAAIRASQTYVALRTTLAQELPELIRLTEKALTLCIGKLVELQAEYYHTSAEMWHDLYDKLHDHESADANVMALYEERVSGPLSRIQALRICAPLPDKKRRKSGGRSAPQAEEPFVTPIHETFTQSYTPPRPSHSAPRRSGTPPPPPPDLYASSGQSYTTPTQTYTTPRIAHPYGAAAWPPSPGPEDETWYSYSRFDPGRDPADMSGWDDSPRTPREDGAFSRQQDAVNGNYLFPGHPYGASAGNVSTGSHTNISEFSGDVLTDDISEVGRLYAMPPSPRHTMAMDSPNSSRLLVPDSSTFRSESPPSPKALKRRSSPILGRSTSPLAWRESGSETLLDPHSPLEPLRRISLEPVRRKEGFEERKTSASSKASAVSSELSRSASKVNLAIAGLATLSTSPSAKSPLSSKSKSPASTKSTPGPHYVRARDREREMSTESWNSSMTGSSWTTVGSVPASPPRAPSVKSKASAASSSGNTLRDDELRNVMLGGMSLGKHVAPPRLESKKGKKTPEKAKERAAPERKNTGDSQEAKPAEDELDEKARRVLEWNNAVQEKRRQREEEKARKEEDKAWKEEERARKEEEKKSERERKERLITEARAALRSKPPSLRSYKPDLFSRPHTPDLRAEESKSVPPAGEADADGSFTDGHHEGRFRKFTRSFLHTPSRRPSSASRRGLASPLMLGISSADIPPLEEDELPPLASAKSMSNLRRAPSRRRERPRTSYGGFESSPSPSAASFADASSSSTRPSPSSSTYPGRDSLWPTDGAPQRSRSTLEVKDHKSRTASLFRSRSARSSRPKDETNADWLPEEKTYLVRVLQAYTPSPKHHRRTGSLLGRPDLVYRGYPLLSLVPGQILRVLQEAGHPNEHPDYPVWCDGGEDCLLLCRLPGEQREGDKPHKDKIGWALASFLNLVDPGEVS